MSSNETNDVLLAVGRIAIERHPAYRQARGPLHISPLGASVALYRGEQIIACACDTDTLAVCIIDALDGTTARRLAAESRARRKGDADDLSVAETAAFLGVAKTTVRHRCQVGAFPGAYKAGRDWRVPSASALCADLTCRKPGRPRKSQQYRK